MTDGDALPELGRLYREYRVYVYRICFRYTRNAGDAEDMSQDVFLKVNRNLPRFRGGSSMSTWIYRIAVNTCIDTLRARKSRVGMEDLPLDAMVEFNLSDHGNASLARIDLGRILAETDPKTREILFMALAEGCGYDEIGEAVGMTGWAVSKIVNRFRQRILERKKAWFAELFTRRTPAAVPAPGPAAREAR